MEKSIYVKRSRLPKAGKGLFAKEFISKGSRIVEYKGRVTTWKEVDGRDGNNGYIYFVKRNHVIDASTYPKALGRYANDANGLFRVPGIRNNAQYVEDGLKVYIEAIRDISAGEEILVDYGKEYWDVIKYNLEIDRKREEKKKQRRQRR